MSFVFLYGASFLSSGTAAMKADLIGD